MFSRRDVLATAAAGAAMSTTAAAAASFGNPDEPPQGAINAKNPASVTDPGWSELKSRSRPCSEDVAACVDALLRGKPLISGGVGSRHLAYHKDGYARAQAG